MRHVLMAQIVDDVRQVLDAKGPNFGGGKLLT
jgi:hypothetical protein